ncbi:MAG TPA: signal recognition particle-docking protein FtsY [Rhodospirillaceae bacterium]|nr:MAG: signal recognition particle-docking protein FtsY [Alphaproteobacteria bacterium GWF2_58_20]HAU29411.1 signal recognition particle-docking protein FtsY [Rhodospirillaceae bacterium]
MSFFEKLRAGFSRTSQRVGGGIVALFKGRMLDDEVLEELEDMLVGADFGPRMAARFVASFAESHRGMEVDGPEVRKVLMKEMIRVLEPVARPLVVDAAKKPFVVLVVGVNGAGKTTTIAKLAHNARKEGHKVMLAAGDTFRAAAIEQLVIWGDRTGCPVVAKQAGADSAAVAFEAIEKARQDKADVLFVDTAGRLHNRSDLMAELEKMVRVMRKVDPSAPHATLLVLDATAGQNVIAQVETFGGLVPLTGLVMTKLDGTARGGILVALAERFGLPVHAIGVGEGVDDLQPFSAEVLAQAIMGED